MAEGYYQKLCVTAIVTPAIRAVDEKTGVKLMNNYQKLRMQFDGKYHRDSFCVVVSKSDDLDCDGFCKSSREARQDVRLQAVAAEINSVSGRHREKDKQLRLLKARWQPWGERLPRSRRRLLLLEGTVSNLGSSLVSFSNILWLT